MGPGLGGTAQFNGVDGQAPASGPYPGWWDGGLGGANGQGGGAGSGYIWTNGWGFAGGGGGYSGAGGNASYGGEGGVAFVLGGGGGSGGDYGVLGRGGDGGFGGGGGGGLGGGGGGGYSGGGGGAGYVQNVWMTGEGGGGGSFYDGALVSALDGANIGDGLVVLSTTGSVPEHPTWAMGLMGFTGIAGIGLFNRRKTMRCIEA